MLLLLVILELVCWAPWQFYTVYELMRPDKDQVNKSVQLCNLMQKILSKILKDSDLQIQRKC